MTMELKLLTTFSLLCLYASPTKATSTPRCTQERCVVDETELRFFLLGDWGGFFWFPYYSPAQFIVARTMGKMSDKSTSHFQLSLGDNFYITGVKNEHDFRFRRTFEEVYSSESLQNPWYIILGNHDHYGNVSAQIAYTQRSNRWVMPAVYYTVLYELSDGTTVDIVMLDTVVMCGKSRDLQFANSSFEWFSTDSEGVGQPDDPIRANQQWTWIEETLRNSRADYLFVAGHYPIYSVGDHGPIHCMDRLLPLMETHNVLAYFSGHDHNLQHIHVKRGEWVSHQIVSGAGGYIHEGRDHVDTIPSGSLQFDYPGKDCDGKWFCWENPLKKLGFTRGGFVRGTLNSTAATFIYYRGDGKNLYRFHLTPRTQS